MNNEPVIMTKKELVMNHEMFKKDFRATTIELLQNYYGDINYMATEAGIYECNNMTNGTPEFFSNQEANEYLQFLSTFILALKEGES